MRLVPCCELPNSKEILQFLVMLLSMCTLFLAARVGSARQCLDSSVMSFYHSLRRLSLHGAHQYAYVCMFYTLAGSWREAFDTTPSLTPPKQRSLEALRTPCKSCLLEGPTR